MDEASSAEVLGPVIAAERVVRWVAVAGVAFGVALGVRDAVHAYHFGVSWSFLYGWNDPLLFPPVPEFALPVLLLVGCGAVFLSRARWTRYLLLCVAVIWFGISTIEYGWSLYKVPTHWGLFSTHVEMFAEGFFWWMTDVLYPVTVLFVLTRSEVKAVFERRGGGGFEPVMRVS